MTKDHAYAMWESYLSRLDLEPSQRILKNPAVEFTKKAKAGAYDSLSDEEYNELLHNCEQEAALFADRPSATAVTLFLRALSRIELNEREKKELLRILADASARCDFRERSAR